MPYKDKGYGKKRAAERYQERRQDQQFVAGRKEYAKQYFKEKWQDPEYRKKDAARQKLTRHMVGIKHRYGLAEAGYLKLWVDQVGRCPICQEPLVDSNLTVVDHNHETGKVRGLVHKKCNTAIGYIEARQNELLAILEYLQGEIK
jgi:hypothetical protein